MLEHAEITEKIVGAAFEVHTILGYGFLEKVYQRAMEVELNTRGLKVQSEEPLKVRYKGVIVGDYEADLLIDDKVIVELKISKEYRARR